MPIRGSLFLWLAASSVHALPRAVDVHSKKGPGYEIDLQFLFFTPSLFSFQSKSFSVSNNDDAATVVKMSLAQFHVQVRLFASHK